MKKNTIVTKYGKMWPREVFDIFEDNLNTLVVKNLPELKYSGVYILYQDDKPYYIGKTKRTFFQRLHDHANVSTDPHFKFWNYFSLFVVPDRNHIDEVEGILIAAMPTANSAAPKINQIKLPKKLADRLRKVRNKRYR